jgi:uncharacterized protein (TIGR02391 family)
VEKFPDRYDQVINQATKILEVRLRKIADLPDDLVGIKLAGKALGGESPRVVLSKQKAEQEGAHFLFSGAFSFLRNPAHHRPLGEQRPERVLQVIAFVDYLLDVLQGAGGSQAANADKKASEQ